MKILLVYATNSGSTYLVSERIRVILARRFSIQAQKAADTRPTDLRKYNLIILGTPSWSVEGHEGYPHETVLALIRGLNREAVSRQRFALFGCGDTSYTYFCGAVDYLEKWVADSGGTQVGPSLRIDGYFFDLVRHEHLTDEWARKLTKTVLNK